MTMRVMWKRTRLKGDKVVDADIEWADDNPLDATVGKERDGENAGGGRE